MMVARLIRKLQVFVSSTYQDLIDERQAAVQAILTAGHIPAGMELFAAGDQSQMKVIQQWIDESDVFMLILGTRYGSLDPNTGKSYIQLEYEYAVEKRKPLFACVLNESARDERIGKLKGLAIDDHGARLTEFRGHVLSRMSSFWSDSKDIALAIHKSLGEFERESNLVGWVRGDNAIDPQRSEQLAQEIARLSAENGRLREQVVGRSDRTFHGLPYESLKSKLAAAESLAFLDQNRSALASGSQPAGLVRMKELLVRGLVTPVQNNPRLCVLTPEGHRFLNLYDEEKSINLGESK
jgi:hypothetical protein